MGLEEKIEKNHEIHEMEKEIAVLRERNKWLEQQISIQMVPGGSISFLKDSEVVKDPD